MVALRHSFPALRAPCAARAALLGVAGMLACVLGSAGAAAQESGSEATQEEIHAAQVEQLRADIANQIQFKAFDLMDELVFSWMESPPFASPTPVTLGDIIAPVGYGSGLEALIENHLAQLLIKNPKCNVQLAHCPSCSALVVHSDKTGTVIGRGVDQPNALSALRGGTGAEFALFMDFEAEGTALVLRARITKLEATLPIVYARTLSSRTSSTALLRSPDRLMSAEQARREYAELLEERGPIFIPVRLALTTFAPSDQATLAVPIPIPWVQFGAEMSIGSARAWTGSLIGGASFVPTIHTAGIVQARIHRLLTGSTFSLTHPNVYGFFGVSVVAIQGPTAVVVTPTQDPPIVDFLGTVAAYPTVQAGLEFRVSNRISAGIFGETIPTLQNVQNVGNWLDELNTGFQFGIVQINTIGVEATFTF